MYLTLIWIGRDIGGFIWNKEEELCLIDFGDKYRVSKMSKMIHTKEKEARETRRITRRKEVSEAHTKEKEARETR